MNLRFWEWPQSVWNFVNATATVAFGVTQIDAIKQWAYGPACTWASVGIGMVGIFGTYVLARKAEASDGRSSCRKEVEVALNSILNAALAVGKEFVEPNLRMCLYLHDKDERDKLIRFTSYVGQNGGDGTEGGKLSMHVGIVGKVFREKPKGHVVATLPEGNDLIQYLVEKWSFSDEMARSVRNDRKSWCAMPISSQSGHLLGIVFLDSSERDFFSTSNSPRRKIIEVSAIPLAQLLVSHKVAI